MLVRFIRNGERRYRLEVDHGDGAIMHLPHGPGFDPWVPHDLVHFVVERHLEIAGGVFGQLAAGGDAGIFFTIPHRRRDPARRRSERLMARGQEDLARSERLASACMVAWHRRRGARWTFADAESMEAVTDALMAELEALAARWHALQVGGTLTLEWPDELKAPLTPARPRERRRTRPGMMHR